MINRISVVVLAILFAGLLGAQTVSPAETAAALKNADYARAHPARESTGLVALPDLGEAQYHGESGGLYPGGKNTVPGSHMAAGLPDGTHPSNSGREKVGKLLLQFLKNDATARVWFVKH
jgi:hypothetical protein